MKLLHFTVEGRGDFPLDMLRYDACYPFTEHDTRMLSDDLSSEKRRVRLAALRQPPRDADRGPAAAPRSGGGAMTEGDRAVLEEVKVLCRGRGWMTLDDLVKNLRSSPVARGWVRPRVRRLIRDGALRVSMAGMVIPNDEGADHADDQS